MIQTPIASPVNPTQVEGQLTSTLYDFSTKQPISPSTPIKKIKIPVNLVPISPSGQFSQKENLTADGRTKATPGDALRSYDDYALLRDYFLSIGNVYGIRNFTLLTIGIATGLRISDLVSLKIGHLITTNESGETIFKNNIDLYEKKTGKRTKGSNDSIIITEAIKTSVNFLLEAYAQTSKRTKIPKVLTLDDWLFKSKQPVRTEFTKDKKGKVIPNPLFGEYVLTEESAHKIFKDAQRDLNFDFDFCTRTTRKTFASLHWIFSRSCSTGSTAGAELTQLSLRHGSVRETEHYLGVTRSHSETVRHEISDWLMGNGRFNIIKL